MHNQKFVITLLSILTVATNIAVLAGCNSASTENNSNSNPIENNSNPNSIKNNSNSNPIENNSNSVSTSFSTPSKNIHCLLIGEDNHTLRCEILSLLNPMPSQPNDCEFDWGGGFLLRKDKQPEILCASDPIPVFDYILSYDSIWTHSGFSCKSQTIGLTCTNSKNQGFFLSREKWKVFKESN